ncbi:MAG: hypothetical protein ACKV0T_29885 [Planctomycetales bacterium]
MSIQYAMMDHAKQFPNPKARPKFIIWGGRKITTAVQIPVAADGIVRGEFLKSDATVRQGFDLKVDEGWIEFSGSEHVCLLRTWRDDSLPDTIEYPYHSRGASIWVWNVYERPYPNGGIVEEKWTNNAGFWVETLNASERIYHCSHGMSAMPDFESLVFKVSVRSR